MVRPAWLESPILRRLLGVAALAAVALMVGRLVTEARVAVSVAYRFGPAGRAVRSARIDYVEIDGGSAASVRALAWDFGAAGAPAEKVHETRLRPGDYRVGIKLVDQGGAWRAADTNIDVPAASGARIVVEVEP